MADKDNNNKSEISQIVEVLKDSNNILITVSRDPGVDQLASCIGLTLALNKAEKHATAVYSGKTPKMINFLEPEKTLEKNTDSLRDFIISLDKSKADKLRYKVEDNVVRIFITPYKTSISDKDLEFSQGDFNVDAIIALGINNRNDLDEAIVAHGRILHDAQIITLSKDQPSELGTINWTDPASSSLSEMVADLISSFDKKLLDTQNATALLTGIVEQTDRFRNQHSSPHTMAVSGVLMAAGASTELISDKLEEGSNGDNDSQDNEAQNDSNEIPEVSDNPDEEATEKSDDGTINIEHDDNIHIDETGNLKQVSDILDTQQDELLSEAITANNDGQSDPVPEQEVTSGPSMVFEPPQFGGQLTANSEKVDQQYSSNPDPALGPSQQNSQTLSELEKSVNSPHLEEYKTQDSISSSKMKTIQPIGITPDPIEPPQTLNTPDVPTELPSVDTAQDAVQRAVESSNDYKPEPIQALNAQPVGLDLGKTSPDPVMVNPSPSGTPPPPVPPPMMPS